MNHSAPAATRRLATSALALSLVAAIAAACGSSAPASTAPGGASVAPSVAAPSAVAPSIALPSVELPSFALPSLPTGSGTPGVDAAAGLTIDPPYTLSPMPAALQQLLETQMAASLSGAGGQLQVGFRQVGGGTGIPILMVMGFPAGTLNAAAYQAALTGMTTSMGATFTTTTVDGVDVSSGNAATGGVTVFHVGDHMLVVIGTPETDGLAIAKALISANK